MEQDYIKNTLSAHYTMDDNPSKFSVRGGGGGGGGGGGVRNLQRLILPILLETKKNSYFSYLCTSTVIRQGWTPLPWKNFLDLRLLSVN